MARLSDISITKKIILAFAALVAIAVCGSGVTYRKLSFIEAANGWQEHTYKVIALNAAMMASMVDQETGLRGFLLAGENKFLEPYHGGQKSFAASLQEIRSLTSDNAEQQVRLDAIEQSAKRWHDGVAEREIRLMAKPESQAEARAIEAGGAGKAALDAIRAKVAEIDAAENKLLAVRRADTADAFATSYLTSVLVLASLLLVSGGAALLLTRLIATPIREMTGVMGELSRDNLAVNVPSLGRGDEVGRMAISARWNTSTER